MLADVIEEFLEPFIDGFPEVLEEGHRIHEDFVEPVESLGEDAEHEVDVDANRFEEETENFQRRAAQITFDEECFEKVYGEILDLGPDGFVGQQGADHGNLAEDVFNDPVANGIGNAFRYGLPEGAHDQFGKFLENVPDDGYHFFEGVIEGFDEPRETIQAAAKKTEYGLHFGRGPFCQVVHLGLQPVESTGHHGEDGIRL